MFSTKFKKLILAVLLLPELALADSLNQANTAWILTSTALVLFMTIPGLSLFYGGLVRSKNVLSVLMQCFAITCLVSILWLAGVYSFIFSDGGDLQKFMGGASKVFLPGIGVFYVSNDVCYYYPCFNCGCVCRKNEVFCDAMV